MRPLLALLTAAVVGSCAAETRTTNSVSTNDVVRLQVTVVDSVLLSSFHGLLTPTGDVDPRFALTLRIDSCVPAITNLKSGTVVTFAVHSPSRFLTGSAEKGKTNEITLPLKKALNMVSEDPTERVQIKSTGHASRELLISGWDTNAIKRRYGEPNEKRKGNFVDLGYHGSSVPSTVEEQWIYPMFGGLGHRLVYFAQGRVVLAVEEWSDW